MTAGAATVSDQSLQEVAVQWGSGGAGAGAALLAGRWIINLFFGRVDRFQERLDAYTARLETRLESQDKKIDGLQAEVEKCHEEKRALAEKIASLEGFDYGAGEKKQLEQKVRALQSRIEMLEGRTD